MIKDAWLNEAGMDTNLKDYWEARQGGASPFEAARHTCSGKMAHRFGFVVWQVHENPNAVFVDFVRTGS